MQAKHSCSYAVVKVPGPRCTVVARKRAIGEFTTCRKSKGLLIFVGLLGTDLVLQAVAIGEQNYRVDRARDKTMLRPGANKIDRHCSALWGSSAIAFAVFAELTTSVI